MTLQLQAQWLHASRVSKLLSCVCDLHVNICGHGCVFTRFFYISLPQVCKVKITWHQRNKLYVITSQSFTGCVGQHGDISVLRQGIPISLDHSANMCNEASVIITEMSHRQPTHKLHPAGRWWDEMRWGRVVSGMQLFLSVLQSQYESPESILGSLCRCWSAESDTAWWRRRRRRKRTDVPLTVHEKKTLSRQSTTRCTLTTHRQPSQNEVQPFSPVFTQCVCVERDTRE